MSLLTDLIDSSLKTRAERGMLVTFPKGNADSPTVRAEVYQSRWIVKCPWCPGATILDPADLRFFCCDCCNARAFNFYVPVERPPDWQAAVAQLMKRPDPATRNYLAHETLADLVAEDAERGVL